MNLKEHYGILALLGIGAIVILAYLLRHKSPSVVAAAPAPAPSVPTYPNADVPLQSPDIVIGGSPLNLTYNQVPSGGGVIPTVQVLSPDGAGTGCACGGDPCAVAGKITSVNHVPEPVLRQAAANYTGYQTKAARVTFSSIAPAEIDPSLLGRGSLG